MTNFDEPTTTTDWVRTEVVNTASCTFARVVIEHRCAIETVGKRGNQYSMTERGRCIECGKLWMRRIYLRARQFGPWRADTTEAL
jgi:hypothetical protein